MELKRYFKIILNWWWLVVISFLVVTVAGFIFTISQTPRYRSTLTMVVSPKASMTELTTVRQSLDTLDNPSIINTYAEIIRSRSMYNQALETLKIPLESKQDVEILVTVIQKTNIINIDAEGENPLLVYQMANVIAEQAVGYVGGLYELYEIKVMDAAVLPAVPFSPDIPRNTLVAAALGLLFGISVSFLAEYLKAPFEVFESFSIIDSDTGLYNKRYIHQRLREEISRAKRIQQPVGFCLVTLRSENQDTETFSKQVQQTIRRRAISMLKRHIRNGEILARWDHDRLGWLLLDASEPVARLAIERLTKVLDQKVFEDEETGARFIFTLHFGAAIFSGQVTEEELVALAEQALHQASEDTTGGSHIISMNGTQPASVSMD